MTYDLESDDQHLQDVFEVMKYIEKWGIKVVLLKKERLDLFEKRTKQCKYIFKSPIVTDTGGTFINPLRGEILVSFEKVWDDYRDMPFILLHEWAHLMDITNEIVGHNELGQLALFEYLSVKYLSKNGCSFLIDQWYGWRTKTGDEEADIQKVEKGKHPLFCNGIPTFEQWSFEEACGFNRCFYENLWFKARETCQRRDPLATPLSLGGISARN